MKICFQLWQMVAMLTSARIGCKVCRENLIIRSLPTFKEPESLQVSCWPHSAHSTSRGILLYEFMLKLAHLQHWQEVPHEVAILVVLLAVCHRRVHSEVLVEEG